MNKKGQIEIPDNPGEFIMWIVGIVITLVMVIGLLNVLSGLSCENEKNKINQLSTDLSVCQSQLQNQTDLTNELNNQCNQKINESITGCNKDLQINLNIVKNYKSWFIIYHITIVFSIIFALNLFKGFLRFEIKVKNRKLKILFKGIKFVWIGIKWILFIGFILLIILSLLILLFPGWFF